MLQMVLLCKGYQLKKDNRIRFVGLRRPAILLRREPRLVGGKFLSCKPAERLTKIYNPWNGISKHMCSFCNPLKTGLWEMTNPPYKGGDSLVMLAFD